jgi:hypothetical protein
MSNGSGEQLQAVNGQKGVAHTHQHSHTNVKSHDKNFQKADIVILRSNEEINEMYNR